MSFPGVAPSPRFGRRDWLIAFLLLLATIQVVRADFLVNETFLDWHAYAEGRAPLPYQGRAAMMPVLRWAGHSAAMRHATARYAITVTIGTVHMEPITVEKFTSMLVGLLSLSLMMATAFWWSRRRGLRPWWMANALVLLMVAAMCVVRATTNYWYAYDLPHAALFGMAAVFALEGWWVLAMACFAVDVPMRETSIFLLLLLGTVLYVRLGAAAAAANRLLRVGAMVAAMGIYWVVVRTAIARHFAGNENQTYPRMQQNLHEIVFPHHWPQLLTAGGYLIVFIWLDRRRLPEAMRWLLYASLACFPVTLWFGVWTESRVWLEWTLPLSVMAATEAMGWIEERRAAVVVAG